MSDWYTWSEFMNEVRGLMPMDSQRLGLQDATNGTAGYLTRTFRQAVIDLQKYIPAYRKNHETLYFPQDFAEEGLASVGSAPPNAMLKEFWMVRAETSERYPIVAFPYARRFELVAGYEQLSDQQGRVAVEEGGEKFYIYPMVKDGLMVSLQWDAIGTTNVKLDFNNDEQVPFNELAVQAVANFAKAEVAREVDKDLQIAQSYMGSYLSNRKDIYLQTKEKASHL